MQRIIEQGKVTFWQALRDYFRGLCNVQGRTTRRGIAWTLIAAFYLITIIQFPLRRLTTYWQFSIVSAVISNGLTWLIILSLVPVVIRRLRDAGIKGWPAFIWLVLGLLLSVFGGVGFILLACLVGVMLFVPTDKWALHKDNWIRYILR